MKILILNGPNLNLLGKREPEIYGSETFDHFFEQLENKFKEHYLEYYQSNHEGRLIDKLHEVGFSYKGIVFNPGAFTHTSIALRDAIAAIETPVYEVHISNLSTREDFRQISYVKEVCAGSINGMGLEGYVVAIKELINGSPK
ncbi:MAG: type II 3-dehydroquinate dehydratase [Bacteroidota bacterium]